MRRRTFITTSAAAAVVATTLPFTALAGVCLSCSALTDVHLIDCTRLLGSQERSRTVCFLCTPEARVIDKYWYGLRSVMHCHKHKIKCSECGVGPGYIHVRGREFEYRLCTKCAPDAVNCRRWVRDLRG